MRAMLTGLAALGLSTLTATAQTYPTQNITLVVAYPAGGVPDVIARILAPALGDRLGRTVLVENRAGASTTVGTASVARAAPDGHTLMLGDTSLAVAPNVVAKMPYDSQKDLAPIALLMRSFMTLMVHPSVPAKTPQEFVALAKSKPGELKYGTSGIGTPPHLGALAFIQATGIDVLHVPYRGVALALSDVVGGHLQFVFVSQSVGASQAKGGNARVLGVFGEKRVASIPDVPTFKESGINTPFADAGTWFGLVTTAGTPKAVIDRLNKATNEALADPAVKAKLEAADFHLTGGSAESLAKLIADHTVYWRESFSKAGVKAE